MTFYVNGEKFTAKGRKNCKGIHPIGSMVVDEYNVQSNINDSLTRLNLFARIEKNDENYCEVNIHIHSYQIIKAGRVFYFVRDSNNIVKMRLNCGIKFYTYDHSGTVTITDMEELEDGQYRIDGRFEGLLVNEAGTDTLLITGGEFRTVTE